MGWGFSGLFLHPMPKGIASTLNVMDIIFTLFESYFWNIATASVSFIVPILSIAIVFNLVKNILWK